MIDYRIGDTRDVIATIPDGTVSLVACSPPFLALRSYLPADHPDKHAEIGSEPDPGTFLDTLLALTADWGRVLAPWGSIAIELGDTFAGSSQGGGDLIPGSGIAQPKKLAMADALTNGTKRSGNGWPRPKCLALIPQAYAMSLAYGRNIITGAESPAGQWMVRNVIVWHRPNPAVGALGDKFRPSTSYITVATRSPKRWFDLTAVRSANTRQAETGKGLTARGAPDSVMCHGGGSGLQNPAGAPPLDAWFDEHDTWTVTTQPSSLAHYAMWPPKLAERLILSMCPERVCATCGEPSRRIEGRTERYAAIRNAIGDFNQRDRAGGSLSGNRSQQLGNLTCAENVTLGWTDCGCGDTWTPGVVLDPFAGTGTTLAVAECHRRNSIGIDIDPRNRGLLAPRLTEVRRNLFGTTPELPGQLSMLDEDTL